MISLRKARSIIRAALAKGTEAGFKPLSVVILDEGGHVIAFNALTGQARGGSTSRGARPTAA